MSEHIAATRSDEHDAPEQGTAPRPTETAQPSRPGLLPAWMHEFLGKYALIVVWALMAAFFWIMRPAAFGSASTVTSIFGGQSAEILLALSVLTTMVVGEFDLSFAFVMGFAATAIPVLATSAGFPLWLACIAGVLLGVAAGAVSAFFVVYLGVSSLVVTLGMGTLLMGLAQLISSSSIVYVISPGLSSLANTQVDLGVTTLPVSFFYTVGLALVFAYVLAWTPLGRSMVFVGANPEVARLAGIRVQRIRAGAYIVAGLFAGLAGLVLVATVGGMDPSTSMTFMLPTLAAVFLGTAVVQPGAFNPVGMLVALFFLTTGIFGLQLLGATGWIQNAFYGGGLVAAVTLAKLVRDRARTA